MIDAFLVVASLLPSLRQARLPRPLPLHANGNPVRMTQPSSVAIRTWLVHEGPVSKPVARMAGRR